MMPARVSLIDSHCHLNYDYSPKSTQDLIREAAEAGVNTLITVGAELSSLPILQEISANYENVFHTIGIHPHEAKDMKNEDLKTLEALAQHPKCKAIGEIGLDYYYDHSPHEIQIQRLDEQLELALRLSKPVVIHSRDAEDDLLKSLTEYAKKVPSGKVPGVIHCFSGTSTFGKNCIDLGFYISVSGILTFKTSESLRETVKAFPLDRLLVETDSPYLAPVPMRGKKCEPSMVVHTATKLAEIKNCTLEEVAEVTSKNTRRVFGLS